MPVVVPTHIALTQDLRNEQRPETFISRKDLPIAMDMFLICKMVIIPDEASFSTRKPQNKLKTQATA